ncbi:MAG TPA: hypothetical protein VL944_01065 [Candidatus Acidoferrum sp.]|nr:hypothetical protein [Candidatus Acidoferrum sp.]
MLASLEPRKRPGNEFSPYGTKLGTLASRDGSIKFELLRFDVYATGVSATPFLSDLKIGNPETSLAVVTEALDRTSARLHAADLYGLRAAINLQLGRSEEALQDAKKATGIFGHATYIGYQAQILAKMGRHDEAAKKYKEAWSASVYHLSEYAEGAAIEFGRAGRTREALRQYDLAVECHNSLRRNLTGPDADINRITTAVKKLLERLPESEIGELARETSGGAASFVARVVHSQYALKRA